jgi:hypothetical protein
VTEEGEAEWSVTADAVQAGFGHIVMNFAAATASDARGARSRARLSAAARVRVPPAGTGHYSLSAVERV